MIHDDFAIVGTGSSGRAADGSRYARYYLTVSRLSDKVKS